MVHGRITMVNDYVDTRWVELSVQGVRFNCGNGGIARERFKLLKNCPPRRIHRPTTRYRSMHQNVKK